MAARPGARCGRAAARYPGRRLPLVNRSAAVLLLAIALGCVREILG
ncbi:MAG: hypothetical protein R2853_09730 [Thermomicrobiales bacterium]